MDILPQSDGVNTLKRVALRINTNQGSELYQFQVNPSSYEENRPQRTTVFKTREANIVEDFGPDLMTINFSGTTGFRKIQETTRKGRQNLNGAQRLFRLRDLINRYSNSGMTTEPGQNPNTFEMIFYNHTDDNKSYVVHLAPEGFKVERSESEPLLYRYSISLIVVREAGKADPREVDAPSIGNPINHGRNPNAHNRDYIGATEGIGGSLGLVQGAETGGSGSPSGPVNTKESIRKHFGINNNNTNSSRSQSNTNDSRASSRNQVKYPDSEQYMDMLRQGVNQNFMIPDGVSGWGGTTYGGGSR